MNFSDSIHRALDYFFCDRCPTEVIDSKCADLLGNICPLDQVFWKHVTPKEPFDVHHPIRWPRSMLGKLFPDRGLQSVGKDNYPTVAQEVMSWKDFDKACRTIAKWATPHHFQDIYGLPRGGLVVAVRLSHLLNLPVVSQPQVKTLVVDDIADTGKTLSEFADSYYTATLYCRRSLFPKPSFWVHEKKQRWIVFPWELG